MNNELGFWIFLAVLFIELAWLAMLVQFLKRTDLDGTTKICWVVVLCTLTLLGLVLFVLFGPRRQRRMQRVSRVFEPAKKESAADENRTSA